MTQARRLGRVPKITANQRPVLAKPRQSGLRPEDAIVIGAPDGVPMLVRTTGAAFNLRKGQQRWMSGSAVPVAVASGVLEVVVAEPPPPEPERPTILPDGAPGSAPELPGRLDQWRIAFTPCVGCTDSRETDGLDPRPASPGGELCETCLAERDGETPLERALRLAGS